MKIPQKYLFPIIVGTIEIFFFLVIIFFNSKSNHQIPKSIIKSTNIASVVTTEHLVGVPVILKIPKINIDTSLEPVGSTSEGIIESPQGPGTAAWFKDGSRPGEIGTAIIDGHYGWKGGKPAIFDHLDKMQPGDLIYIEDDTGTTYTFVVRTVRIYDENKNDVAVVYSDDKKSHLNLITCTGVWNKVKKSYSGRLVVFAEKKS